MSMEIDGEEVVSPLIFEEIHPLDGRQNLSLNVREAMAEVRALVEFRETTSGGAKSG